jgi:tetratricopeptide (TPR) repeat protein
MLRGCAFVLSLSLSFMAIPARSQAAPPDGWPATINTSNAFEDIGRAIAKEPDFPKDGTDASKARYVFSRLPDMAKAYKLSTSNVVSHVLVGFGRKSTDTEGTETLKKSGLGSCAEWSYALQAILSGVGVNSKVIYADSFQSFTAPSFVGNDTALMIEEHGPNGKISRRIFDPFHAASDGFSADSVTKWSDRPLTDYDRWKDEKPGHSWQSDMSKYWTKPYVKDQNGYEIGEVQPKFQAKTANRPPATTGGKSPAEVNDAKARIEKLNWEIADLLRRLKELGQESEKNSKKLKTAMDKMQLVIELLKGFLELDVKTKATKEKVEDEAKQITELLNSAEHKVRRLRCESSAADADEARKLYDQALDIFRTLSLEATEVESAVDAMQQGLKAVLVIKQEADLDHVRDVRASLDEILNQARKLLQDIKDRKEQIETIKKGLSRQDLQTLDPERADVGRAEEIFRKIESETKEAAKLVDSVYGTVPDEATSLAIAPSNVVQRGLEKFEKSDLAKSVREALSASKARVEGSQHLAEEITDWKKNHVVKPLPDLAGKTREEAIKLLTNAGFQDVHIEVSSELAPAGKEGTVVETHVGGQAFTSGPVATCREVTLVVYYGGKDSHIRPIPNPPSHYGNPGRKPDAQVMQMHPYPDPYGATRTVTAMPTNRHTPRKRRPAHHKPADPMPHDCPMSDCELPELPAEGDSPLIEIELDDDQETASKLPSITISDDFDAAGARLDGDLRAVAEGERLDGALADRERREAAYRERQRQIYIQNARRRAAARRSMPSHSGGMGMHGG